MINEPITVILPLHNAEQHIQHSVREVMDLAHSFVGDFSLVIVDNGSTDETFETACELERVYPQIRVLREPFQQGLRKVLDSVRNYFPGQTVICHDGMTEVNVDQLRSLLQSAANNGESQAKEYSNTPASDSSLGSRRLGSMRNLQESMERAHGSLAGFSWMKIDEPLVPRRCVEVTPTTVVSTLPNMPMNSPVSLP